MGAKKIMVIRHAEKPGLYNGLNYAGVGKVCSVSGAAGAKHLTIPCSGLVRRNYFPVITN